MANTVISVIIGIVALVLGGYVLKLRADNRKARSVLTQVIEAASGDARKGAEEQMAQAVETAAQPVRSDIDSLEKAKERVDKVMTQHALPADIQEIARRSAERVKAQE